MSSNQAMERTVDRCAFTFEMTSTLSSEAMGFPSIIVKKATSASALAPAEERGQVVIDWD